MGRGKKSKQAGPPPPLASLPMPLRPWPNVGALVAVTNRNTDHTVCPARVLGYPSDVHVQVQFVLWEDLTQKDPLERPATVPATWVAPLSVAPSAGRRVQQGDVGLVAMDVTIDGAASSRGMRRFRVTKLLEGGAVGGRTLPRAHSSAYVHLTAAELATDVSWMVADFIPRTRDSESKLLCTPVRSVDADAPPLRQAFTARQLTEWQVEPASVTSQLSLTTTPMDYVTLRSGGVAQVDSEYMYAARWGADAQPESMAADTALGGLAAFAEAHHGGKGTERTYSRWSCSMCATMLDRINAPPIDRSIHVVAAVWT